MSTPPRKRYDADHDDTPQHHIKYDPADFIIVAQDAKGHSERVGFRISPADDRALDTILASKKFPFRTKGDIMRWGVHVAIRRLERMEDVPSVTQQVDATMLILRDEMFNHEFMATFEALGRVIQQHLAGGANGEARRLVTLVKDKIQKMPDGHWRDKYLSTLEERYGHIEGTGASHRTTPGRKAGANLRVASGD